MYTRSDSLTVTQERFALSRTAARSTEPEVFTFERIPAQVTAVRSYVPIRPKKRCTRVMYPAKVRMHLPPPEKNQAKRWLLLLSLVLLWQIYTEEPCADAPLGCADPAVGDYQGYSFQSAEPLSGSAASQPAAAAQDAATVVAAAAAAQDATATAAAAAGESATSGHSPDSSSRPYEQSAGMVALLVYHRLGTDN